MSVKKYFLLSAVAFVYSCGDVEDISTPLTQDNAAAASVQNCSVRSEMWLCHNPGSYLHDRECNNECYVQGEADKFCWRLHKSDCYDPENSHEWREKYCGQLFMCD
jgi:hypothetical protein